MDTQTVNELPLLPAPAPALVASTLSGNEYGVLRYARWRRAHGCSTGFVAKLVEQSVETLNSLCERGLLERYFKGYPFGLAFAYRSTATGDALIAELEALRYGILKVTR